MFTAHIRYVPLLFIARNRKLRHFRQDWKAALPNFEGGSYEEHLKAAGVSVRGDPEVSLGVVGGLSLTPESVN